MSACPAEPCGLRNVQHHLSYLPYSGSVLAALAAELTGYQSGKGSLHFHVDEPLPPDLVSALVATRMRELGLDKR
jgi:uncharacterized protein YdhG (YjbR/CyaY superfamily)